MEPGASQVRLVRKDVSRDVPGRVGDENETTGAGGHEIRREEQ